jgi:hypothetical protein
VAPFRRAHRRGFGRPRRFHFAWLLTIVVLAYLLVPWIVELIEAGRGYSPFYYEPKDFSRQEFIARHGLTLTPPSWRTVLDGALVIAVVLVWLTLLPRRR